MHKCIVLHVLILVSISQSDDTHDDNLLLIIPLYRLTGFEEAAILQQVNWLEITGKFDLHNASSTMTLSRSYKVYYVLKFNEDAFGWNHAAIKFKVKLHDDDEGILSQENTKPCEMEINLQPYREKPGLWHQIPVGEFKLRKAITALNVEVGMFEVETDWWKGSMILGGIKIKPNYC